MDSGGRALWGMLYADDGCIVSRSLPGLATMMAVGDRYDSVSHCQALALIFFEKTDGDPLQILTACSADDDAGWSGRAKVQTDAILHLLGRRHYRKPGNVPTNARRTGACWMRIRRYLRELYDQPKVKISHKIGC